MDIHKYKISIGYYKHIFSVEFSSLVFFFFSILVAAVTCWSETIYLRYNIIKFLASVPNVAYVFKISFHFKILICYILCAFFRLTVLNQSTNHTHTQIQSISIHIRICVFLKWLAYFYFANYRTIISWMLESPSQILPPTTLIPALFISGFVVILAVWRFCGWWKEY